jgi:16S rRNA (adenine1518-N6/adenine1519-N6)-dimethyltransferase
LIVPFEDPRRVLARHGLRPRREWSQSFLVNGGAVLRIASLVGAAPGDVVVEIGAGLGTLTRALAAGGARVVAIEPERDTARVLRAETAGDRNVEVIEADALRVDLASLARGERLLVAGNLPYAIAAPILVRVAEAAPTVSRAVLMVQAEMAERVAAKPGTKAYGALTIAAQASMNVRIGLSLGPGSFHPPPRVRSAVLVLEAMDPPRVSPAERAAMRPVVQAAFQRRRKTLRNALVDVVASSDVVDRALSAANVVPTRRGETLTIEEFAKLATLLLPPRS